MNNRLPVLHRYKCVPYMYIHATCIANCLNFYYDLFSYCYNILQSILFELTELILTLIHLGKRI